MFKSDVDGIYPLTRSIFKKAIEHVSNPLNTNSCGKLSCFKLKIPEHCETTSGLFRLLKSVLAQSRLKSKAHKSQMKFSKLFYIFYNVLANTECTLPFRIDYILSYL